MPAWFLRSPRKERTLERVCEQAGWVAEAMAHFEKDVRCRILVVEDEPWIAADLETSLCDLGYQVIGPVGSAAKAIPLAQQHRPDLVLMDIHLDGPMSGIEVAETVRRNLSIPVVFLTAYTGGDLMQKARAAGAYGFLSKPLRIEELNATILIALEQHRLSQQLFAEHNWLLTLLASLSDGVIATDATGAVRYLNPAAEELTRWSLSQAMGKPIEQVYPLRHMDGSPVSICLLRRALETGKPIAKGRFLVKTREGFLRPVEDAAAPIFEGGHLVGAVTIFLDISARLAVEARQQEEHGRLTERVQSTSAALGQTQDELRALSGRMITAQEDERRRVARELHDDLGQRAALMGLHISELSRLASAMPGEMQEKVASLQQELHDLAAGLRSVSHQLHPTAIADLGLGTALREVVEQMCAQGMDVTLVAREMPHTLPVEVATALFRITQEALRNALHHADGAPVVVALTVEDDTLALRVEDCGPGFDLQAVRRTGGLGLVSMGERARLVGGALQISSSPCDGTTIAVRVPLQGALSRRTNKTSWACVKGLFRSGFLRMEEGRLARS